jgi:hypothetical protein
VDAGDAEDELEEESLAPPTARGKLTLPRLLCADVSGDRTVIRPSHKALLLLHRDVHAQERKPLDLCAGSDGTCPLIAWGLRTIGGRMVAGHRAGV